MDDRPISTISVGPSDRARRPWPWPPLIRIPGHRRLERLAQNLAFALTLVAIGYFWDWGVAVAALVADLIVLLFRAFSRDIR